MNLIKKTFLSPIEKRREIFIPLRFVSPFFSLNRDVDYFCYVVYLQVLSFSLLILAFLLLDIIFGWNIAIGSDVFATHKFYLIYVFSKLMGPTTFILSIIFYLRIRFAIDLEKAEIPCIAHPNVQIRREGKGRKSWIKWSWLLIFSGIIVIFISHIFTIGILKFFGVENSIFFVLLALIFPIIAVPYGAVLFVYGFLVFEKIFRYCSEAVAGDEIGKTIPYKIFK